jgi:hypothetical protein
MSALFLRRLGSWARELSVESPALPPASPRLRENEVSPAAARPRLAVARILLDGRMRTKAHVVKQLDQTLGEPAEP